MLTAKSDFRTPPQTATIGMWLFLSSLAMLFAASMFGYAFIRLMGPHSPDVGTVHMPPLLWLSTILVLAASGTIHLASRAVRAERQTELRRYLLITLLLAAAFVAVQTPAMISLIGQHFDNVRAAVALNDGVTSAPANRIYGLVFFLVLVHALHVLGGIVSLGWVTYRANRGAYDHESFGGVKHAAMYWHFLDVVWLVMFGTLFLVG